MGDRRVQRERGQAIVIIALVMIALIAMMGLTIDGGGLFFLYRDVQNAVDAAVLEASYAICTDGDPLVAALEGARENGFDNDNLTGTEQFDDDGWTDSVRVNYPPLSGPASGNAHYVEVIIDAKKPAYFIHLVYPAPLIVSNRAVGYCQRAFDPATIPGVWAGGDCQDGIRWGGSNGFIDGGLFSNWDIKFSGSTIVMGEGEVEAVHEVQESQSGNVAWHPDYPPTYPLASQTDPLDLDIGDYAPGGSLVAHLAPGDYHVIDSLGDDQDYRLQAGGYLWQPKNRTLSGLYYVRGRVDVLNSAVWDMDASDGKYGATIAATGEISVNFKNDSEVRYFTRSAGQDAEGVLFYSALESANCGGDEGISMTGSHVTATGALYAPRANISASASQLTLYGVMIAWTADWSGSQGTLIYPEDLLPPRAPRIGMVE